MEFGNWLINLKKRRFILRRFIIKKDYKEYISTKYLLVKKENEEGKTFYYLRTIRYRVTDFSK